MILCVRNLTGEKLKLQKYNKKKRVKNWNIKPRGEEYIKVRPKEGYIGISKTGKFLFVKKERGIKKQTYGEISIEYFEINQACLLEIIKN